MNRSMQALGAKRSAIRELFEFAKEKRAKDGEDSVFDFSLGNPSVPTPQAVTEALTALLTDTEPTVLHGYTSAQGDAQVRGSIAAYIKEKEGFAADPGLIYMTVGAAAALTISLHALLNPGDEVIVPTPYFPEYKVFIEKAGGVLCPLPTEEPDFLPSPEALAAAITDKTKAILLNSPNNPTGAVIPEALLCQLCSVLRKASAHRAEPIYIISDEPYRELVYGDTEVPYIPKLYDNTLVCYSYSKSLSLPGERIGYILVPPMATEAGALFEAVMGAGRALGYVCAPSLFQQMILRCPGVKTELSVYEQNRTLLYESLSDMGFVSVYPAGAFYLFVKAPLGSADEFSERAKAHGILLVPGDSFGAPGYVRIAYCVSTEMIKRSLPHFRALAKEYGL